MDMNLQKYMAFVKTVETGSFTKAALALRYSQSGISRMIADLESEWGVSLLERGRGGVRLTSDGLRLLPYAKSVLLEYQKLQAQLGELSGLQTRPDPHRNLFQCSDTLASRHHPGFSAGLPGHRL